MGHGESFTKGTREEAERLLHKYENAYGGDYADAPKGYWNSPKEYSKAYNLYEDLAKHQSTIFDKHSIKLRDDKGEYILDDKGRAQDNPEFDPAWDRITEEWWNTKFPQEKNIGGQVYNTGGLVSFLKEKEGYRDKAYQDQAGVWTMGYGRTTNPCLLYTSDAADE